MRYSLLILALLLPLSASAQLSPVRSGGLQPTTLSQAAVPDMGHGTRSTARVSGTDHGLNFEVVVPDGGWVYGIELGEKSDVPCHLRLRWATIDDDEISVASSIASACHGNPTSRSMTAVGFNYRTSYDEWAGTWTETFTVGGGPLGLNLIGNAIADAFDNSIPRYPMPFLNRTNNPPVALKGVKVCQRNSNDRMKGLAVRGVTLQRDAANGRFNTRPVRTNGRWSEPSFERPNCNDWDDMEVCPNGEVMVGVRVEGERNGNFLANRPRMSIEGLAPICARLMIED